MDARLAASAAAWESPAAQAACDRSVIVGPDAVPALVAVADLSPSARGGWPSETFNRILATLA